jgi:hypothetical protein
MLGVLAAGAVAYLWCGTGADRRLGRRQQAVADLRRMITTFDDDGTDPVDGGRGFVLRCEGLIAGQRNWSSAALPWSPDE